MTLTRTTRADAAAYALSLIGRTRDRLPVLWTDSATIDDCARFCSHVLWGGWPISWVDNFKSAGDGTYIAGSGDLQPWDVLLFDWEHNGVGNHVEFFVSADADPRYVRTYGANGSDTRVAAYRRRPVSYILGRFRPRWEIAPAPIQSNPITTTPVGEIMPSRIIKVDNGKGGYSAQLVNPDTMQTLPLNPTAMEFWANAGVPVQRDVQAPRVLQYFTRVKGKGAV